MNLDPRRNLNHLPPPAAAPRLGRDPLRDGFPLHAELRILPSDAHRAWPKPVYGDTQPSNL